MGDLRQIPFLVLGCGVAGLAAAKVFAQSGVPFLALDREDGPGGLVRTDQVHGYRFDRAGHFIHARSAEFRHVLEDSGIQMAHFERKSAVLFDGRVIPYPVQFNLWACDRSFSSAVTQEIEQPCVPAESGLRQTLLGTWGPTLTERFFRPYLEKMWGRTLEDIPSDWGSRFVPKMDAALVGRGSSMPIANYGYNSTFSYPASGRIGDFPEALASKLRASLLFDAEVLTVDVRRKLVMLADGGQYQYSQLVSTLPLNSFLTMLGRSFDATYLMHSNLLNVRVGFLGRLHRDEHWLYLPDPELRAFRVGLPRNFSVNTCPEGRISLSLEVGLGEAVDAEESLEDIAMQALNYLARCSVLHFDAVDLVDGHLISPAYVAHRLQVTPYLQRISDELESQDIFLAGRYGAWDYISIEEAYLSGETAARRLLGSSPGSQFV